MRSRTAVYQQIFLNDPADIVTSNFSYCAIEVVFELINNSGYVKFVLAVLN